MEVIVKAGVRQWTLKPAEVATLIEALDYFERGARQSSARQLLDKLRP